QRIFTVDRRNGGICGNALARRVAGVEGQVGIEVGQRTKLQPAGNRLAVIVVFVKVLSSFADPVFSREPAAIQPVHHIQLVADLVAKFAVDAGPHLRPGGGYQDLVQLGTLAGVDVGRFVVEVDRSERHQHDAGLDVEPAGQLEVQIS